MTYALVAALAVIVAVFTMQNTTVVSVRFLVWEQPVPLAGVILLSLGVGIVLVGVPLWVQRWHLRARLRAVERRMAASPAPTAVRPGEPDA